MGLGPPDHRGPILATGFGLFGRRAWAGVTAIFLAMLSALAQFMFIPYYPFWAITVIALDIWVIWALTRPGAIETSNAKRRAGPHPARCPAAVPRARPRHSPLGRGARAGERVAQRLLGVARQRRLDDLARDLDLGQDLLGVHLADEHDERGAARLRASRRDPS